METYSPSGHALSPPLYGHLLTVGTRIVSPFVWKPTHRRDTHCLPRCMETYSPSGHALSPPLYGNLLTVRACIVSPVVWKLTHRRDTHCLPSCMETSSPSGHALTPPYVHPVNIVSTAHASLQHFPLSQPLIFPIDIEVGVLCAATMG